MHKILFYNKFITRLYMFRILCAHHQEVKIVLYSLWYHHTYRCDDTRGCIIIINQLDALNLFYNKFISCLYMFRTHLLIVRKSKLYYTVSGIITPVGGLWPCIVLYRDKGSRIVRNIRTQLASYVVA